MELCVWSFLDNSQKLTNDQPLFRPLHDTHTRFHHLVALHHCTTKHYLHMRCHLCWLDVEWMALHTTIQQPYPLAVACNKYAPHSNSSLVKNAHMAHNITPCIMCHRRKQYSYVCRYKLRTSWCYSATSSSIPDPHPLH